jgi:ApaG protein
MTDKPTHNPALPGEKSASNDNGHWNSDTTTKGIRVQVRSAYLPKQSAPTEQQYFFTYHVKISNAGSKTAQLVSREWVITDATGQIERVKGQGVIGEQPVLAPGTTFEYSSFCPLSTAVGAMQGSYQMRTPEGEQFDAVIAPFTLAVPYAVH